MSAPDPNVDLFAEVLGVMDRHGAFQLLSYQEQAQVLVSMAADRSPTCVHGCGSLNWADDTYHCPGCGDETDLLHAHLG